MSENRVIGKGGDLPWRLPVDLKHFQASTRGHAVIMGRKTWESLPGALPERRNLVVTRQDDYQAKGAEVCGSLDEAFDAAKQDADAERVFVLGGAEIYAAALPSADELWVTFVHASVDGDTFFPDYDITKWRLVEQEEHPADRDNEHACTIARLEPKKAKKTAKS